MPETTIYPFTNRTYVAIAISRGIAAANGHANITAAHFALGILGEGGNIAISALARCGVPLPHLRHQLESELPPTGHPRFGEVDLPATPGEAEIVDSAALEVAKLNDSYLGNEHLLLAMLSDESDSIAQVFSRNGVTYETFLTHLRVLRSGGTCAQD